MKPRYFAALGILASVSAVSVVLARDWPYAQRPSAAMALGDPSGKLVDDPLRRAGERFIPPELNELPNNDWGKLVRLGRDIFIDTPTRAPKFAGNGLNCSSCHLGEGRKPDAAPTWAAWPMYPTYRGKNDDVNTFQMRIQDCFRFSMDGLMPPLQSTEIRAITAYAQWLARGSKSGQILPGRGFTPIKRDIEPSADRGRVVYQMKCALCHGHDGEGVKAADGKRYQFPPVWGDDAFNRGAGMYTVRTAAAWIKGNMPLGRGMSLPDQEAFDVALYLRLNDRPIDPRKGLISDWSRVMTGF